MKKLKSWFNRQPRYSFIGLVGVAKGESVTARRLFSIFSYLKIFVAFWLLYQWQMEIHLHYDPSEMYVANILVWLFFAVELSTMLFIIKDRSYFLSRNWFAYLILIVGIPYIFNWHSITQHLNEFRPALALVVLIPAIRMIRIFLSDGKILTTLLASGIVVVVIGLIAAGIDPGIHSGFDGIWWALATVSTVGYGDVVPTSIYGKLIGMVLIVIGLGLFVVLTANLLSVLLKRGGSSGGIHPGDITILNDLKRIQTDQKKMMQMIEEIKEKQKQER